jgi:hypothetical protein
MPAIWGAIAGSAISGGFSLLGQSSSQSASNKAAKAANKQAKQDWKYDEKVRQLTNNWNLENWQNEVANEKAIRQYQNRLAIREYNYARQMQDYEYRNAMRAYAQSEQNYKLQLSFNNMAAAQAYEAENNKLREIKIGAAFQSQDMMIENLQEEGVAAARGQAGRSAAKTVQSISASYGRNIAILTESMKSAERQTRMNLEKIDIEKYGADLAASAARMLKPERLPSLPKPEKLPKANIIKPLEIPKRKKPVSVSGGSSAGGYLSTIGSTLGGIASAYIGSLGGSSNDFFKNASKYGSNAFS